MQKSRLITFYAGATLYIAPTLASVTEAIRLTRPYEEFFLNGEITRECMGNKENSVTLNFPKGTSRLLLVEWQWHAQSMIIFKGRQTGIPK